MESINPASFNSEDSIFFPNVKKIPYKGPTSMDPLTFKHYNPDEVILGKKMRDWCRFSVCFWHTFRGTGADMFGAPTIKRPWDDQSDSLENCKRRVRAAFEFMSKLGVDYYTFHDRDVSPERKTLKETNADFDLITDLLLQLQKKTGIKLLWATQNLFSHPRYMNGAATNPEVGVLAYAAMQTKKCMEVNMKLGGENYVFWGGREGYQTILNTDIKREIDHYASFLKMVVKYKKKIGMKSQLLIEPKPREPTKHQYDYDAQTVISFLQTYNLEKDFKLNIEPNHTTLAGHDYEHDIIMASKFGMLGSIDANTGDKMLGWDTDQFPMNIKKCAILMKTVVEQGGLQPGGLNFDCKLRRESTEIEDMFIAHIAAMDSLAKGLKIAVKIIQGDVIPQMIKERYQSFDKTDLGKKIEEGQATFEDCEAFLKENPDEPNQKSGKQEKFESIWNCYM